MGYRGVVTAGELESALGDDTFDITGGDLAHLVAAVAPDVPLDEALRGSSSRALRRCRSWRRALHLLGWLTHRDILAAYNNRIESSVEAAETVPADSIENLTERLRSAPLAKTETPSAEHA